MKYIWHLNVLSIHKNKDINIEKLDNNQIEEELLVSLKQDWANLLESVPGKLFEINLNSY